MALEHSMEDPWVETPKVANYAGRRRDGPKTSRDRSQNSVPRYDGSRGLYETPLDYLDGDLDKEIRPLHYDKRSPARVNWADSPWPNTGEGRVKRIEMKPPSFYGRGSVRSLLAKFDNCALHNCWTKEGTAPLFN